MAGGAQPAPVPYLRTIKTLAGRIPIQRRLIDCAPNAVPTIAAPLWSTLTEVAGCTELLVTASLTAQQVGTPASNFCLCVQSISAVMWSTSFTPEQGGAGYTGTPTATITGDGTGASVTPVMANNRVVGFTGLVGGSGYTYATVAFSGGGSPTLNAAAYAVVSGGAVIGVFLVSSAGFLPGEAVSVPVPHGGLGVITDQTTLAVPKQAQLQPGVFGGFVRAGIWATVPFPTSTGLVSVTLQGK